MIVFTNVVCPVKKTKKQSYGIVTNKVVANQADRNIILNFDGSNEKTMREFQSALPVDLQSIEQDSVIS